VLASSLGEFEIELRLIAGDADATR
jgi:hypothetical protein